MQSKRGELVPIGEVFADLDGPAGAPTLAPGAALTSPWPIR